MVWMMLLTGCFGPAQSGLSDAEIASLLPDGVAEEARWAHAVGSALKAAEQPVTRETTCQVLAVIEQESGYVADPEVAGLAGVVHDELLEQARGKLGVLGDDLVTVVLAPTAEGAEHPFAERMNQVKTEQDVDRLYRDIVAHHLGWVGSAVQWAAPALIDARNPITTAGSMQVSTTFAMEHPESQGMSHHEVRDAIYTLEGGVLYGTLRLFDHAPRYADPAHLFADYNAGQFASRNAAFQAQLSNVSGIELATDGDLLAYNARGKARAKHSSTEDALVAWMAAAHPEVEEGSVRKDLKKEKTAEFENTRSWKLVRAAYGEEHGELDYAMVPNVTLDSPKLSGQWTTSTFATRTKGRYERCLQR